MLRSLRLPALVLVPLALFACRGGDDDDDNPGTDARPIDGPVVTGATIQEVQNAAMVPGTQIELHGKIVTAIDNFGTRKGNFYVAEPGGGEFSGVLVFNAPLDQVALLAVGDVVDIIGAEKDEFDGTGILSVPLPRPVTEVVEVSGGTMTVTKTGTAPVPAPHVLDALAIGQMAEPARLDEYEKWAGVLVTVNNVSALQAIRGIGSSGADDCTFRDFGVTGYLRVDSSLAAIPAVLDMTPECPAETGPNTASVGDCLASVSGVMDYFYDYKILVRATSDIVGGGTSCPVAETGDTQCDDGIDNDANTYVDCADRSCSVLASCQVTTTIVDIQNGTLPKASVATISNVVVTGISFNKKNLWVSDALQGAPNNGIYVFVGGSTAPVLPGNIVVGARVNIVGTVDEFNGPSGRGVTRLANPTITFVSAPAGLPTPVTGVLASTLVDNTTGEPYEGVLVQLTNVRIAGPILPPPSMTSQRPLAQGTTTFLEDDDIYRLVTEADGTCYSTIIGIWHYDGFSDTDNWVFVARDEPGDRVVSQTPCP